MSKKLSIAKVVHYCSRRTNIKSVDKNIRGIEVTLSNNKVFDICINNNEVMILGHEEHINIKGYNHESVWIDFDNKPKKINTKQK